MSERALLDGSNTVVQVVMLDDPNAWVVPDGLTLGADVGDPVLGATWDGVGYVVPAPALPTADELKTYAADKRWAVETGGAVVGGISIPTDDRAKILLLGAATSMAPTDTANYIVGNASVVLTGAQFAALYAGLVMHVQSCFEIQDAVLSEIDAETITTTAEIDAANWP